MSTPIIKDETDYVDFLGYTDDDGSVNEYTYLDPTSIVFHNTADFYSPIISCKNTTNYTEMYHNMDWYDPSATVAHYYVDGFLVTQIK